MKSNLPVQKLAAEEWVWPIDLTEYNRDPQLTSIEKDTLGEWKNWFDDYCWGKKWPPHFRQKLNRLLLPIFDSMKLTKADRKFLTPVLNPILQEMFARQTAYWNWSEDDWLEIWHKYFKKKKGTKGGWRQHFIGVMYFVGGVTQLYSLGGFNQYPLSVKVFGLDVLKTAVEPVRQVLSEWGYGEVRTNDAIRRAVCEILLINRSPYLMDIKPELLKKLRDSTTNIPAKDFVAVSRAMVTLGFHEKTIEPTRSYTPNEYSLQEISGVWAAWCHRWLNTSTLETRDAYYSTLLRTGRWLARTHSTVASPEQWTRELATDFVAAILRFRAGDWSHDTNKGIGGLQVGKDCSPRTKHSMLVVVRTFFKDCQDWGWYGAPNCLDIF